MSIAQDLLPEFDQEMAITRNLLACVPADRAGWRPHPRSTALGDLALHIATLAGFGVPTATRTEVDMSPPDGPAFTPPTFTSTEALLETFDANVAASRAAIAGISDEDLQVPWSLKAGGQTFFTMPRAGVLRGMLMNHVIHHRGQLSVYLRLNDVALPSIYGPTADSPM